MTDRDYVTGSEFSRWMAEEQEFRARLERRMADNAQAVQTGLNKIEEHLADINGRTRKNSEAIAAATVRLDRIEHEDQTIEQVVQDIRDRGCSQLSHHADLVQRTEGMAEWSGKKKAGAAAGLVGLGALIWPAIQEIASAVHALVDWLAKGT